MGKKRGKSAKSARRNQILQGEGKELVEAPHSFVIHRGQVGKYVMELVKDMRRVMSPFTAEDLKVKRKNKFKDFVSVAGPLHVSHMMMFTKTEKSVNFRLCRLPRGPTLTFQVKSYCLARDVLSTISRHNMEPKQFNHHPLLVMNNFKGEDVQVKLMASMFQNLFPPINVDKVKLNNIRRCVLLNYDAETMQVEFRHFNIRIVPVGVGRAVKKIVQSKIPNLSSMADISEYVINAGNLSESEAEQDGPENKVVLPQNVSGRGNMKSAQSAVRLTEIGPRMTLKLVKIEGGLCSGEILYHALVKKTPEEMEAEKVAREKKRQLKAQRRAAQEARVSQKEKLKLEERERSRKAAARAAGNSDAAIEDADQSQEQADDLEIGDDNDSHKGNPADDDDDDDDAQYYRKAVGAEPDSDLFPTARPSFKRKRPRPDYQAAADVKRRRTTSNGEAAVHKPYRDHDQEGRPQSGHRKSVFTGRRNSGGDPTRAGSRTGKRDSDGQGDLAGKKARTRKGDRAGKEDRFGSCNSKRSCSFSRQRERAKNGSSKISSGQKHDRHPSKGRHGKRPKTAAGHRADR